MRQPAGGAVAAWSTRSTAVHPLSDSEATSPAVWPVSYHTPVPGWIINPEYGACLVTGEAIVGNGKRYFRVVLIKPLEDPPVSEKMYSVRAVISDRAQTLVDFLLFVPAVVMQYQRDSGTPGRSLVKIRTRDAVVEMFESEVQRKIAGPVPEDPVLAMAWDRFRQSNPVFFSRMEVGVRHIYSQEVRQAMEEQSRSPAPVQAAIGCAMCDRHHKRITARSVGASLSLDFLSPPKP